MKIVALTLPNGAADGSVLTLDATGFASWETNTGGGGGGAYSASFSDTDLVAGILTVTHNLVNKYVQVAVYDNLDNQIIPTAVVLVDDNSLTVDFNGSPPITGTWNVVVAVGSSGQALGAGYLPSDGDGSQLTGVVHTAGDETVAGVKTFTNAMRIQTDFGATVDETLEVYDLTSNYISVRVGRDLANNTLFQHYVPHKSISIMNPLGYCVIRSTTFEWQLPSGEKCLSTDTDGELLLSKYSSTSLPRPIAKLARSWSDSTDATRKGRLAISACDQVGMREGVRIEATGTGANVGLVGGNAFGGGTGVVNLGHASVAPTQAPVGGSFLWSSVSPNGVPRWWAPRSPEMTLTGCIYSMTVSGTSGNNTGFASLMGSGIGTYQLPANFWTPGKTVKLFWAGMYASSAVNTYMTMVVQVSSVDVAIGTVTYPGALNPGGWIMETTITCLTTGTGGTFLAHGEYRYASDASGAVRGLMLLTSNPAVVDTTAPGHVTVHAAWGAQNPSNSITARIGRMEVLN